MLISNRTTSRLQAAGAASLAFTMLGGMTHAMADTAADSDSDQPTEVIVKGQREIDSPKRPEPLRDTPKSVTVIPQQLIQSTGSASLVEALRTVPGITFGAGEGGNPVGDRPFLRGYDSQSSTFVDGLRDIGSQSREVFNTDSIEIIKGASGAYAGRGGAGGGIYINSKTPVRDNFTTAQLGLGSADYKRATLDVNHVLDDGVAVRFNAMVHDADVDGRDFVHYNRWGIAPSITAGLGTNNRFTLSYYHLQSDDEPDSGIPYNNPTAPTVAPNGGTLIVPVPGDGEPIKVDRNTWYGNAERDFRKEQSDMATFRYEHSFGHDLHLRNTTRYAETRQGYIWSQPDDSKGNLYYGYIYARPLSRVSDVTTLINQTDFYGVFMTGKVKHNFSTGLELSEEKGQNDLYNVTYNGLLATTYTTCPVTAVTAGLCIPVIDPNGNAPFTGTISRANNPTKARTTTKALYAFDTIEFSEHWQANLGVRFDDYDASFTTALPVVATTGLPAAGGVRSTFKRRDDLFNYQAALVYKPVKDAAIYISYATAATPAGNGLAQGVDGSALSTAINAALKPQKDKTLEAGAKWDMLDGKLSLTGAVFEINTDNARITNFDASVSQAGKKRVRGFELGLSGSITEAWDIFAGYTYLDAILVKNGGSGAAAGLLDGAPFPNTPKNSASLWTTYKLTPRLTIGGGATYMDKVYGNANPLAPKWVPSYTKFDAMASYIINDHLTAQLNVQNLTDEVYFSQAYTNHYATIAPGRSVVLTLNARF